MYDVKISNLSSAISCMQEDVLNGAPPIYLDILQQRMELWKLQQATDSLPFPSNVKILLCGLVSMGLGDFKVMVFIARRIKELFPQVQLLIAAEVVCLNRENRLPQLEARDLDVKYWGVDSHENINFTNQTRYNYVHFNLFLEEPNNISPESIIQNVMDFVDEKTFVVNLPHMDYECSIIEKLRKRDDFDLQRQYMQIIETQIPPKTLAHLTQTLGFQADDLGVFLTPPLQDTSISTLQDPALASFLTEKADCHLYYGYIHESILDFLSFFLYRAAQEKIDSVLVLPEINFFDKPYVKQCLASVPNIAKLQMYRRNDEGFFIEDGAPISNSTQGITIHLIHPFPLQNQDVQILIAHSQSPVGCTGDMSLYEVLSYGKLPLYERPHHKPDVMHDLACILQSTLPKDGMAAQYFNICTDIKNYKSTQINRQFAQEPISWELLNAFHRNPDHQTQFQQSISFLRKYLDATPMLLDLIKVKILNMHQ